MQKRYWLRVGITLAVIHLIIALVMLGMYLLGRSDPHSESIWAFFLLGFIDFPSIFFLQILPFRGEIAEIGGLIIGGTVQWALIGGLLGSLYGRIKNKKQNLPSA